MLLRPQERKLAALMAKRWKQEGSAPGAKGGGFPRSKSPKEAGRIPRGMRPAALYHFGRRAYGVGAPECIQRIHGALKQP